MLRLLALALFPVLALLASCAPPYTGIPYEPATTALLRNHNGRKGHLYKWESYGVQAVDSEAPKFVNPLHDEGAKVVLRPGRHLLVVGGTFQRGINDPQHTGRAEVECRFEAGKVYRTFGSVEGPNLKLWIEEIGSGRRVSKVVSAPHRVKPTRQPSAPLYIPLS